MRRRGIGNTPNCCHEDDGVGKDPERRDVCGAHHKIRDVRPISMADDVCYEMLSYAVISVPSADIIFTR